MEQFINPRVKDIQISGIRQFSNMIQNYDNLISLTIGQPDFPTPSLVKKRQNGRLQKTIQAIHITLVY